jgi:soluble lytic murein transglycosylase-like protein
MRLVRGLLSGIVTVCLGLAAAQVHAAPLQALSSQDVQLYTAAFDAAERGDYTAADLELSKVTDPCLVGQVRYIKLTHPKASLLSFDELAGWLKVFGDLPGADRIYALALKVKPPGAAPPAPTAPQIALAGDDTDQRGAPTPQSRAAREAYFDGDLGRAQSLAKSGGDAWIAGLAAYRLGNYAAAEAAFETIADNLAEKDAQRAAGAFWAARSAVAMGAPDRAPGLLKIAAAAPETFYGLIAARKLALAEDPMDGVIEAATQGGSPANAVMIPAAYQVPEGDLGRLVSTDPRAHRAVALAQIGRQVDAGSELRAGIAQAPDGAARSLWMKLLYALNPGSNTGEVVLHADAAPEPPPPAFYPIPDLAPAGGYTVDKALVYAVVWQESRFNSLAVSPVGAIGLMQLMPPSAASVAGDSSLTTDPIPLFDTGKNLQLGQAYLNWLMTKAVGYDILRAVAAYNGGPATVSRTVAMLGPNTDDLLLIESLPYAETRGYVQKVMTAYWTYRREFGADSRTLDAAASDGAFIDARLDTSTPSQDAKPPASAPAREALEILLHHAG